MEATARRRARLSRSRARVRNATRGRSSDPQAHPTGGGVAIHYVALVGLIAVVAWLVVPRALGQVETALGVTSVPTSASDLSPATKNSTGVQHEILVSLQKRLRDLPSASRLVRPGLEIGKKAFEILIGVFFVGATAAYWIFERDRTIGFVCSLIPDLNASSSATPGC